MRRRKLITKEMHQMVVETVEVEVEVEEDLFGEVVVGQVRLANKHTLSIRSYQILLIRAVSMLLIRSCFSLLVLSRCMIFHTTK